MTIDKISHAIIPQYMQDERPDTGIQEKVRQQNSLPNPLVLRERSRELIILREQSRELIERDGRFRRDKDAAVVTLTGRQSDVPRIPAASSPPSFV
ncbi:MAG: hypothetical protein WA610_07520, partial [Thermodesulfovibrionales bacterium]